MKRSLLIVLLALLATARAWTTPIVQLGQQTPYQRIATQAGWWLDSTARLTIAQVQQPAIQSRFQPARHEMGAYGITSAAVWIQGSYTSPINEKAYLLIEFANIDSIELYYYDSGILKTVATGSYAPQDTKAFNIPGFCFEMPATGQEPRQFWLRIRTGNAMIVPLAMATADGLPRSLAGMYIIALLYAGVVGALFFYNLSLCLWIRERKAYIHYLGYLFFLAIFVLLYLRGLHVWLGQPLSYLFNQYAIGAVAVSYLFAIRFAITFLHGDRFAPRLSWALHKVSWLMWAAVIACLVGWRSITIRLQEFASLTIPILFIWMALLAWRRQYRPAIYFIIAWSLLLATIVLFAITNMGLLPFGNWTFHILPIGSALEVILLSLALGYRYALLEKEKRAQKEVELQSVNHQNTLLEKKASERTLAWQETMARLEESNRTKEKLLNIIAHDIRSPLNNLAGYLELAEKRIMETSQVQQFIQVLRRNVSSIARTMNNLLNWSLIQKEHIETIPSNVLLVPMARQLLDTYRFSAEQKGLELKLNIPEKLAVVADSHQIELVLRNLIDNAIKFTPRGGSVTLGCRPRADDTVLVYVSDTGEGMTQEAAEKLLQRNGLYTAGVAGEKGTGLGLQLCREFVAGNGGELGVRSHPGEGTEFHFILPGKWMTP